MVCGQVMAAKNNLYVDAARSIGASHWRILVHHILPNCISPTIVQVTLDAGYVVLVTSGLSFVGLGAQPPTPEWGALVSEGRKYIVDQWWWPTFPGLAICLLVVGFTLVGDFLRDLLDPRLHGVPVGVLGRCHRERDDALHHLGIGLRTARGVEHEAFDALAVVGCRPRGDPSPERLAR